MATMRRRARLEMKLSRGAADGVHARFCYHVVVVCHEIDMFLGVCWLKGVKAVLRDGSIWVDDDAHVKVQFGSIWGVRISVHC